MNWKMYKNELLVLIAVLLMLIGVGYKQHQISLQVSSTTELKNTLHELKEVIALQKLWADKRLNKKIDKLKTVVAPSKIKWQKRARKLHVSFHTLSSVELNRVISKILNTPVQIQRLDIQKSGIVYHVEFKCKW